MLLFYRDETIQNLASSVEKGSTPPERQKLFGACTEKKIIISHQCLVQHVPCCCYFGALAQVLLRGVCEQLEIIGPKSAIMPNIFIVLVEHLCQNKGSELEVSTIIEAGIDSHALWMTTPLSIIQKSKKSIYSKLQTYVSLAQLITLNRPIG